MDLPTRELHDAGAVADVFGVARRTVNDWRRRGEIPFVQVGRGTIRFDLEEVLQARHVDPRRRDDRAGDFE
ncbi:MAG: helix-turn-helix domain-containing protein [Planctomycetes bacterium]|nr:helix-turn-helix domain-containing protein [Planctomycetota bacterium]